MARSDINCVFPSHHVCTATATIHNNQFEDQKSVYSAYSDFRHVTTHDGNRKCVRQGSCETTKERIFARLTRLTLRTIRNEPRARCSSSVYAVRQITGVSEFQSQQGPNQLSGLTTLLSNADEPSPRNKETVTETQPSPPCKV